MSRQFPRYALMPPCLEQESSLWVKFWENDVQLLMPEHHSEHSIAAVYEHIPLQSA